MNMEKLRKQIKESFFNPILHFLPLIIFLVVDDFYGMSAAWRISFPVAFVLLFYVYFVYNRIYTWHLIFTVIFIVVSVIASLEIISLVPFVSHNIACELVIIPVMLGFLLFRKQIKKLFQGIISDLIPMSNNFEELYRVIWVFFSILLFYVAAFLTFRIIDKNTVLYQKMLQYVYISLLLFFVVYEMLRVKLIRSKLIKEEWWPIVSNQGKIVGSIHYLTSLQDEKKYLHPVVRVLLIEDAMILLEKKSSEDLFYPGLWDNTISSHARMGETIERCVERTAEERYSITDFKYMHLANYTLEVEQEKQYVFLFVCCQQYEFKLNSNSDNHLKWWTHQQIEENLETGIFTDNFKIEFDLLKRSGLLETGKCECKCRLRDVIYNQPNTIKHLDLK